MKNFLTSSMFISNFLTFIFKILTFVIIYVFFPNSKRPWIAKNSVLDLTRFIRNLRILFSFIEKRHENTKSLINIYLSQVLNLKPRGSFLLRIINIIPYLKYQNIKQNFQNRDLAAVKLTGANKYPNTNTS